MWTFYEIVTVVRGWGNTGNFPKAIAHHERHRRPERCFLQHQAEKEKALTLLSVQQKCFFFVQKKQQAFVIYLSFFDGVYGPTAFYACAFSSFFFVF